jgi:hypothetical protein
MDRTGYQFSFSKQHVLHACAPADRWRLLLVCIYKSILGQKRSRDDSNVHHI